MPIKQTIYLDIKRRTSDAVTLVTIESLGWAAIGCNAVCLQCFRFSRLFFDPHRPLPRPLNYNRRSSYGDPCTVRSHAPFNQTYASWVQSQFIRHGDRSGQ